MFILDTKIIFRCCTWNKNHCLLDINYIADQKKSAFERKEITLPTSDDFYLQQEGESSGKALH